MAVTKGKDSSAVDPASSTASDKAQIPSQAKPLDTGKPAAGQASSSVTPAGNKPADPIKPVVPGNQDTTKNPVKPVEPTPQSSTLSDEDLREKQSAVVYEQVLQHLDWDNVHKNTPAKFQPYVVFVPETVEPVIKDLQASLKVQNKQASRLDGAGRVQKGQIYSVESETVAKSIEKKMYYAKPRMGMGYDLCEFDGKLQSCRVIS